MYCFLGLLFSIEISSIDLILDLLGRPGCCQATGGEQVHGATFSGINKATGGEQVMMAAEYELYK